MKYLLLLSLLCCAVRSNAQTYFYVDNIVVDPSAPTPADNITIDLIGNLSSTGAYVVTAGAYLNGSAITLAVDCADQGGLAVLVPHVESIAIGTLPTGTYTIDITGTGTGDFAPAPEHTFIVSGGNADACDTLQLLSLQYATLNDTVVELTVANPSSVLFDYPGFILFDANSDTLAKESVSYFGIGSGPQTHVLRIHPNAVLPPGPFTGTLELWTGFYSALACSFPVNDDLCPSVPCTNVSVYIENVGGALVNATFDWVLTDSLGTAVATGQLSLGNPQYDTTTVCLPPGVYQLEMIQPNPVGGQLFFGLDDLAGEMTSTFFVQGGAQNTLDCSVFAHCTSIGMIVPENRGSQHVTLRQFGDRLILGSDHILGAVRVVDQQGRVTIAADIPSAQGELNIGALAVGTYLLIIEGNDGPVIKFLRN